MKIKIITKHAPSNYGSLLQSIATLTVLKRMGHEAQIIDYQRPDERGLENTLTNMKTKPSIINNPVKKLAYICLRYPLEAMAFSRFEGMRHKYLDMTPLLTSHEELEKLEADVFMTGSDQVWSDAGVDKYDSAFFLSFVKKGKKVAYAASFGKTKFDDATVVAYKKMLSSYDAISVREDAALDLIKSWNLKKYELLEQVLDPTLLLNSQEWSSLIKKNRTGKYVLVYQIHNDKKLNLYAKKLAKHLNIPLLRVNPQLHQIVRGGKFHWCPDVSDFLSLVKNATVIVTDSFHGTCFSINFNKQFVEILPNTSTGSRNQSILRLTGLQDRILKNENDFDIALKKIDYAKVNMIVEKERSHSLDVMKKIIEC